MDKASSERRYDMQDHPLFDAKSSKDDLRRTLSDGIVVEAHVEGERIVGYTARPTLTGPPYVAHICR